MLNYLFKNVFWCMAKYCHGCYYRLSRWPIKRNYAANMVLNTIMSIIIFIFFHLCLFVLNIWTKGKAKLHHHYQFINFPFFFLDSYSSPNLIHLIKGRNYNSLKGQQQKRKSHYEVRGTGYDENAHLSKMRVPRKSCSNVCGSLGPSQRQWRFLFIRIYNKQKQSHSTGESRTDWWQHGYIITVSDKIFSFLLCGWTSDPVDSFHQSRAALRHSNTLVTDLCWLHKALKILCYRSTVLFPKGHWGKIKQRHLRVMSLFLYIHLDWFVGHLAGLYLAINW